MDLKETCPGFKILEEDIAGDDEDIVTGWYLDYSFYIMKRKEHWKWILCGMFQIIL